MIERKRLLILLPILLFCLFSVVETIENPQSGVLCIVSIIACNIFWGTAPNRDRKTFIYFNITFFVFLVGKMLVEWYDDSAILSEFTNETLEQVYIYMAISLACITVGSKLSEMHLFKKGKRFFTNTGSYYCDLKNMALLLQIVEIAYYISMPCYILTMWDQASFVSKTSYIDYYINYSSSVPYFVTKIGELNQILFALLICLEYRKEKLIFPVGLFLLGSIISLGMGQRNIVVLNLVMLMAGLVYANQKSKQYLRKSIYTQKQVWLACMMAPLFLYFLTFWGAYRFGRATENSIQEGIKDFFVSQGGQVSFFAYTVENKSKIWSQPVLYTFSAIYNYFRNLFGMLDYSMYSRRYAMEGNSLAVTQFYISSPTSLESGRGSGGCYLSELYYDGGILGIVLGSLFLGWVLGKLQLKQTEAPWKNAYILLMIRWIVYIPRASYFDWIPRTFNIWNVTIVILIYSAVRVITEQKFK